MILARFTEEGFCASKYPPPLPFLLSSIPSFLNSSSIHSRNLNGMFFDITDETILRTLQVKGISVDYCADDDSISLKKYGTGLTESIEERTSSFRTKEVMRQYSFTLQSNARALALTDFSYIQLDYKSQQSNCSENDVNDDDSHRWLYLSLY